MTRAGREQGADCTISRQMVTQSSVLTPHSGGDSFKWRLGQCGLCREAREGALLWNEIWDMRITRNYSQSQLVTNHLCLTITHEPLSPANQFLHQLSFNRSGQFTIIPGLGETLTCTLQFWKVWTLAHDNRQWEAKPSILSHSFSNK